MNREYRGITSDTSVGEAVEILKQRAEAIAQSPEAEMFNTDNPSWSNLFREEYPPYQNALKEYEAALEINEWLNGANPDNGLLTISEAFAKIPDYERLNLFYKRINTKVPSVFDECLQQWWINRY
jgi:hypothetical protein